MSEEKRLAVPEDVVTGTKSNLKQHFPLFLIRYNLKEAANILQIATNVSSLNAELVIITQEALFDLIKICDGISHILTSFRIGAHDIVEALHVAYLYLVDGFPDMAFTKMESLQKSMKSMQKRVQDVIALLDKMKERLATAKVVASKTKRKTLDLKLCEWLLDIVGAPLDQTVDYCKGLLPEVDRWLTECREVAQPQMERNQRGAEGLSQEEQRKYWEGLLKQKEVIDYLARWKALSLLCDEYSPEIRALRNTIDVYYTTSKIPREAIKGAWRDAELLHQNECKEDETLKSLLERHRKQDGAAAYEEEEEEIHEVEDDRSDKHSNVLSGKELEDVSCLTELTLPKKVHRRHRNGIKEIRKMAFTLKKIIQNAGRGSKPFKHELVYKGFWLNLESGDTNIDTKGLEHDDSKSAKQFYKIKDKLMRTLSNLSEAMERRITKLQRDLGEKPTHTIRGEHRKAVVEAISRLEQALIVIKKWHENCKNVSEKRGQMKALPWHKKKQKKGRGRF